ncbi:MAG: PHP domain-containing protein [Methanomassiliicoccales archaeon]|nr:PHP domain-containing protein [Methanomassiliicoccales archaeon]
MASKADIHVHSKYSGLARLAFLRFPESVNEPRDILKRANLAGLNLVCVADHNTVTGGLKAKEHEKDFPGTEVIVGEEVSTRDGEILGLFLQEDVPKGLSAIETIERIRAQDGLVVSPHPFSKHVPALGLKVDLLNLDGLEVLNAGHVDGYANNKALRHASSGKWALLGGSDSHSLNTIGCAFTEFEGNGGEDFRREILAKRTRPGGKEMTMDQVVAWSMGVVFASDVLILRSMLGGILEKDALDPVLNKVLEIGPSKKVAALVGSLIYFTPPIPFLVGIIGERVVKRLNSVPVHEVNGNTPLLN